MITVTVYDWVPDFAKGLVRDLRVRWALEEAGLPYQTKLINHEEKLTLAHRALQPFSQIPVYDDGAVNLFESGAIVLRIAEKCEALLPKEDAARARGIGWMFAALNSVEPFIMQYVNITIFNRAEPWAEAARPNAEEALRKRLDALADWLKGQAWLETQFSAGDLLMVTVLRNLRHTDIVTAHPVLGPYLSRGEARPAFQKALTDQLASFKPAP